MRAWRGVTAYAGKGNPIFPNWLGAYLNHDDMVKRKFLPLIARLAAKWKEERRDEPLEAFTWHALRYFAISYWIEAGLPPKTLQTFADRSSLQVNHGVVMAIFRSGDHGRVMDGIARAIANPVPICAPRRRASKRVRLCAVRPPYS